MEKPARRGAAILLLRRGLCRQAMGAGRTESRMRRNRSGKLGTQHGRRGGRLRPRKGRLKNKNGEEAGRRLDFRKTSLEKIMNYKALTITFRYFRLLY